MNYKNIVKNSDINNDQDNNIIYDFISYYYKDNINYLNEIKMLRLFGIHSDYLPYSICYILIHENNKSINKLPPSLKMLCLSTEMQIQLDNIYNLPLLIKYMHMNNHN